MIASKLHPNCILILCFSLLSLALCFALPCTNLHLTSSMCKLGELSKFLDYSSNVLEISSQLIWNIPVTYWKFPVGSKMILLFLDMFEAFKNSEKNRISLFHVSLPILTIKPSIYKGFSKLERIIIMVLCIFK